ncbi:hypothetical protein PpBr36_07368 [Pyricularia pennisetigena]|nr:hypothetical protein PpBr36_07368 [Pyricularia pennisetigena]TLS25833.1 hypothetical protein PpBr36_07368 [Pyricularia pennisetigena]
MLTMQGRISNPSSSSLGSWVPWRRQLPPPHEGRMVDHP